MRNTKKAMSCRERDRHEGEHVGLGRESGAFCLSKRAKVCPFWKQKLLSPQPLTSLSSLPLVGSYFLFSFFFFLAIVGSTTISI